MEEKVEDKEIEPVVEHRFKWEFNSDVNGAIKVLQGW